MATLANDEDSREAWREQAGWEQPDDAADATEQLRRDSYEL